MSENSCWENVGLGVSSDDEQVSTTAGPSCNIEKQETPGEARTGSMGTVNGGFSLAEG